jgi:hypothetical protein
MKKIIFWAIMLASLWSLYHAEKWEIKQWMKVGKWVGQQSIHKDERGEK